MDPEVESGVDRDPPRFRHVTRTRGILGARTSSPNGDAIVTQCTLPVLYTPIKDSATGPFRRHQTCYFRKRAASVTVELGGKIHNVSRNRHFAGAEVAHLRKSQVWCLRDHTAINVYAHSERCGLPLAGITFSLTSLGATNQRLRRRASE